MSVELFVEPRKVYSWEDFKIEKPPYSIALDGFVGGSTCREIIGPYANFDHHNGCDRFSTRCTSAQVHMEINMGLFESFCENGNPKANVFINDPDEDTCLSYWLLKNGDLLKGSSIPSVNRLVYCEDMLDCTAGAYPFGDISIRRKMAYIFEPYNLSRFNGQLAEMDSEGMKNIVDLVSSRISSYVLEGGKELTLSGDYEILGGGKNWVFTRETGPLSRMAMYDDGLNAFMTLVSKKENGSFVYVGGRKSVWVPFDLSLIVDKLNKIEGDIITLDNCWGGSNTIIGSPRITGSRVNPQELEKIIEEEILC